jgi:hypothetical protein
VAESVLFPCAMPTLCVRDLDRSQYPSRRSTFRTDFPVLAHGNHRSDHLRGDVNGGGPVLRTRGDRGNVSLRAGQ